MDNTDISSTGALPDGPASYEIELTVIDQSYQEYVLAPAFGDTSANAAGLIVLAVIFSLVAYVGGWRRSKKES